MDQNMVNDPVMTAFFDNAMQSESFTTQQNNPVQPVPEMEQPAMAPVHLAENQHVGDPLPPVQNVNAGMGQAEGSMLPLYGDNTTAPAPTQPNNIGEQAINGLSKTIENLQQSQNNNLELQHKLLDSMQRSNTEQGNTQQPEAFNLDIKAQTFDEKQMMDLIGSTEAQEAVKQIIATTVNPYLDSVKQKIIALEQENQQLKTGLNKKVQDEVFLSNTYSAVPNLEVLMKDASFNNFLDAPNASAGGLANRDIFNTLLNKRDSLALTKFVSNFTNPQATTHTPAPQQPVLPAFNQAARSPVAGSAPNNFPPQYQSPQTGQGQQIPSAPVNGPHIKYSDYLRISQAFERGEVPAHDYNKAKQHFTSMMMKNQVDFDVQADANGRFPILK